MEWILSAFAVFALALAVYFVRLVIHYYKESRERRRAILEFAAMSRRINFPDQHSYTRNWKYHE